MRISLLPALLLVGTLAACTTTQGPSSNKNSPSHATKEQVCRADQLTLKGQQASAANVKRAQEQTTASQVRLIHPDRMYTTDYKPERLSIRLDENEKIVDAYCG